MSIKPLAVFLFALVALAQDRGLFAESASPSPAPSASVSASPSPAAGSEASKPGKASTTPSATPDSRTIIDGLSQGDLDNALNLLKSNYVNPSALSDQELSRATLQGLLARLAPGVSIFSQPPPNPEPSPFLAEILDDRIGYLRLGSLAKGNLDLMDAALQNFNSKMLKSVVLDLRATTAGSDFDLAAEVIKRFSPKGKVLFTVKKTSAKQERIITSNQDPSFQGLVVVLVDKDTSGAAEVVAAALRIFANAMIVGQNTPGQAVEFSDLTLPSGKILRIAVSEVVLPGNVSIFPNGVKPDVAVAMPAETKREIFRQSQEKGVSQFVFETERLHMNEASLVAGTNPELDALQAAQRIKSSERPKPQPYDVVLQHAIDLITSIGIYETKSAQ